MVALERCEPIESTRTQGATQPRVLPTNPREILETEQSVPNIDSAQIKAMGNLLG
jgi:hypothetical protein